MCLVGAKEREKLKENKITHILAVHDNAAPEFPDVCTFIKSLLIEIRLLEYMCMCYRRECHLISVFVSIGLYVQVFEYFRQFIFKYVS